MASAAAVVPGPEPIRVLIVDDSAVVRGTFGRAVDATPDMRVVTTAINGQRCVPPSASFSRRKCFEVGSGVSATK